MHLYNGDPSCLSSTHAHVFQAGRGASICCAKPAPYADHEIKHLTRESGEIGRAVAPLVAGACDPPSLLPGVGVPHLEPVEDYWLFQQVSEVRISLRFSASWIPQRWKCRSLASTPQQTWPNETSSRKPVAVVHRFWGQSSVCHLSDQVIRRARSHGRFSLGLVSAAFLWHRLSWRGAGVDKSVCLGGNATDCPQRRGDSKSKGRVS